MEDIVIKQGAFSTVVLSGKNLDKKLQLGTLVR